MERNRHPFGYKVGGMGAKMPSADYYRQQAKALLSRALATSDRELANGYALRAQEFLSLAIEMELAAFDR